MSTEKEMFVKLRWQEVARKESLPQEDPLLENPLQGEEGNSSLFYFLN